MPDYVIEPPDVLRIEVARIVPKSPYVLSPGDGLQVQVSRPDGTIVLDQVFYVELDGSLQFGAPFDEPNASEDPEQRVDGPLQVSGLNISDARKLIRDHISKTVSEPFVRVSLKEFAAQQPVSGEHLVGPDGTVNLGTYGRVYVAGLTIEEARARVDSQLQQYLQNPNPSVDVYSYNSKTYYIILQGAGLGDRVAQFPVTGNETVLDALSNVEGLSGTSSEEIWVSRPGHNVFGGPQVLPVHWGAITQLADPATNYQLMPGDRVFVREDSLVAIDTHLGKFIAPMERVFGFALLGTNSVSRLHFYKNFGQAGGQGGGN
ncbi:MAG: polysaccharide biosynthesis/export family protein [Planctomyces sp.]|nr:polysaccharide biosynthesis/export family protein [Planctomyces sp.]